MFHGKNTANLIAPMHQNVRKPVASSHLNWDTTSSASLGRHNSALSAYKSNFAPTSCFPQIWFCIRSSLQLVCSAAFHSHRSRAFQLNFNKCCVWVFIHSIYNDLFVATAQPLALRDPQRLINQEINNQTRMELKIIYHRRFFDKTCARSCVNWIRQRCLPRRASNRKIITSSVEVKLIKTWNLQNWNICVEIFTIRLCLMSLVLCSVIFH